MEEEGQPEMDILLELAFLGTVVWKLCCFAEWYPVYTASDKTKHLPLPSPLYIPIQVKL